MRKLLFFFLVALATIGVLLSPAETKDMVIQTLTLWFLLVLPAIAPMYLLSHLLIQLPFFTKALYPLLKPLMHFENETACAIYVVSILSGNPTSTSLITAAEQNGAISINEANRLIKFCSFISPLFIINFSNRLHSGIAVFFILSQVFASITIAYFLKEENSGGDKGITDHAMTLEVMSNIISSCPVVLLNIASTMVFVNLIKLPFSRLLKLMPASGFFFQYLLCLLEIGTGLNYILNAGLPLFTSMVLYSIMLSFAGGAIHLQVITLISKKDIPYAPFLYFRLIHVVIALVFLFGFIFGLWQVMLIIFGTIVIINIIRKGFNPKEKRKNLSAKLFL